MGDFALYRLRASAERHRVAWEPAIETRIDLTDGLEDKQLFGGWRFPTASVVAMCLRPISSGR
jgi:hypothetical protein